MDIQPKLAWTLPYLASINDLIPLGRLTSLSELKSLGKTNGMCHRSERNTYKVTIQLRHPDKKSRTFEDVLFFLAHELAHILEWEHTTEHSLLMVEILRRFFLVAKDQGIKGTDEAWDLLYPLF